MFEFDDNKYFGIQMVDECARLFLLQIEKKDQEWIRCSWYFILMLLLFFSFYPANFLLNDFFFAMFQGFGWWFSCCWLLYPTKLSGYIFFRSVFFFWLLDAHISFSSYILRIKKKKFRLIQDFVSGTWYFALLACWLMNQRNTSTTINQQRNILL